jgi:hypothetical protein
MASVAPNISPPNIEDPMTEFEWPHPGETWWRQAGRDCRASDLQTKFAALITSSVPATEAYKRLSDDTGPAARAAASRLSSSVAVRNLTGLYRAEIAGADEGTVSQLEARTILSRIARNADPSTAVRALETLSRLNEKAEQAAANQSEPSTEEVLAEIASISPELAAECAAQQGVECLVPEAHRDAAHARHREIATRWIQDNVDEALKLFTSLGV